jgi:hypothetical protein
MARVKANLFDAEGETQIVSVEVERDRSYQPGGWFETEDGGTYVVAEVRNADPPLEVELDAVWIDGPDPTSLLRRHS